MVEFGSFTDICKTVSLVPCAALSNGQSIGLEPECFSRNVELGGVLVFQSAALIMYIVALVMTTIMVYHIKTKYTAVGRKEIVIFFYLYLILIILEFLLQGNFIQMSSSAYPWFAAIHTGVLSAMCWCLMLNGFVGFQFTEDGTRTSVWLIRLSSGLVWFISALVAILTFKGMGGMNPTKPMGLFIIYYILNGLMLLIYIVMQIILVVNTLDDRWPLGDIAFGVLFFAIGQVVQYVFSTTICESVKHYIDGLFFGVTLTLLSVMMIYKYWDSITKEDLEFSVGGKLNVWEVKEEDERDELLKTPFDVNPRYSSISHTPVQSFHGGYDY
ncbi:MAG: putative chitin biosynthesis protein [Piptocephalis tieghemiana]|nr:MAG: putative chitin biosynthesis protein [Piptocephalis tieghemiana]